MGLFITVESENDRYARQVRNAAGIAVFIGQQADPAHWVEVGRYSERFALQATALGVRNAFLNPPMTSFYMLGAALNAFFPVYVIAFIVAVARWLPPCARSAPNRVRLSSTRGHQSERLPAT